MHIYTHIYMENNREAIYVIKAYLYKEKNG